MVRKGYTHEQIINKLREAEVLIEAWRKEYNQVHPQGALGYLPPAPEAMLTMATR